MKNFIAQFQIEFCFYDPACVYCKPTNGNIEKPSVFAVFISQDLVLLHTGIALQNGRQILEICVEAQSVWFLKAGSWKSKGASLLSDKILES